MRNYVIINGVNSLTIKGLAIKTLPPITKPIQRNLREEIDGRDGDIVTTLGYGAYDKTIEIGLFGTFDIDEVIAYFNQKGTITFSNEADKVYYFQALEQVDYAELLKFRTANVVLHCQPFKYPTEETPLEEEYEYVTGTGTNITLDNTEETEFNEIELQGNTSQTGTPTPDSPIPVNVVSGDNYIDICGKNLANPNNLHLGYTLNEQGALISHNPQRTTLYQIKIEPNMQYVLSTGSNYQIGNLFYYDANKTYSSQVPSSWGDNKNITTPSGAYYISFATRRTDNATMTQSDIEVLHVQIEKGNLTTYEPYIGNSYPLYLGVENRFNTNSINQGQYNANASLTNIRIAWYGKQVVSGETMTITCNNTDLRFAVGRTTTNTNNSSNVFSQDSGWQTGTYTITYNGSGYACIIIAKVDNTNISTSAIANSDYTISYNGEHISTTPIELCKIETYQDYIYKDNGSWYLHKEIGKVVLDGSESWGRGSNATTRSVYSLSTFTDRKTTTSLKEFYSDNFGFVGNAQSTDLGYAMSFNTNQYSNFIYVQVPLNVVAYDHVDDFKTWLSIHNTTVYYVLATPTNTEITDTTLIEQLEALKNAESYEGQTNISQTNNDMPFVLDVSALKENSDHLVIDNVGNIYSKPTLDLEGTGIVDIYLNDTQMFEVDLSEKNEIVIDTEKMEAYNPTDNTLANRQVTGDYSKFKLESGENELRFSGDLTKATITKYIRWL